MPNGTTHDDVTQVTDADLGASAGNKNENPLMSGRPTVAFPGPVAAKLEEQRMLGQIVSALASMSWGQRMTPVLRRATAQYCLAYGIDPLTELDMLGGNPYPNAEFYLRKLGELRIAGIVADYWLDNIANDPELLRTAGSGAVPDDVREWSVREHWRRWQRRRELGAKDEAEAVCVCSILLAGGGHPVVGWKQGGGGTSIRQNRSGGGSAPNPIVEDDNNTALAVESQSARRAVRQLASHVNTPGLAETARYFAGIEDGARELRTRIEAAKPPRAEVRPFGAAGSALAGESYGYAERGPEATTPAALPAPTYGSVLGDSPATGQPEAVARVASDTPERKVARAPIGTDPYTELPTATAARESAREPRRWAPTNVDIFPGNPARKSLPRKASEPGEGGEEIRVCPDCGRTVNDSTDHAAECPYYPD